MDDSPEERKIMLYPLEHYTNSTEVKPRPHVANGANCRNGYGVPVIKYWEPSCAYCGKDLMESYDNWLDLSVDHVVPICCQKTWGPECREWIESMANAVPCCRACNEFLNGFRAPETAPASESEFISLRNKELARKREHALQRHQQEQAAFEALRSRLRQ